MSYWAGTSPRCGVAWDELRSLLQKSLRRSLYAEVGWAAAEFVAGGKTIWTTLQIVAAEDVGPSTPKLPLVLAFVETWCKQKQKQQLEQQPLDADGWLPLMRVLTVLCDCKKTRVTALAAAATLFRCVGPPRNGALTEQDWQLPTLAVKVRDGRRNAPAPTAAEYHVAGALHAALVEMSMAMPGRACSRELEERALMLAQYLLAWDREAWLWQVLEAVPRLRMTLLCHSPHLAKRPTDKLHAFHNILSLARGRLPMEMGARDWLSMVDDLFSATYGRTGINPELERAFRQALEQPVLTPDRIPDWALDKHTRRGKQLGRGMTHFFDVGSVLDARHDDSGRGIDIEPYNTEARRGYAQQEQQHGKEHRTKHVMARAKPLLDAGRQQPSPRAQVAATAARLLAMPPAPVVAAAAAPQQPQPQQQQAKRLKPAAPTGPLMLPPTVPRFVGDGALDVLSPQCMVAYLPAQTPTRTGGPVPFYAELRAPAPAGVWVMKGPYSSPAQLVQLAVQCYVDRCKTRLPRLTAIGCSGMLSRWVPPWHPQYAALMQQVKQYGPLAYLVMRDVGGAATLAQVPRTHVSSKTFLTLEVMAREQNSAAWPTRADYLQKMVQQSSSGMQDMRLAAFALVLFFRYAMEISDTCALNVLVAGTSGEVVSIDEPTVFRGQRPTLFKTGEQGAPYEQLVAAAVAAHSDALLKTLQQWGTAGIEPLAGVVGAAQQQLFRQHVSRLMDAVEEQQKAADGKTDGRLHGARLRALLLGAQ